MDNLNYTQVNNKFIEQMNKYNGNEVKIFIAICRKTIGWHKTTAKISYSKLKKITGLSVNSLKTGIKTLVKDQWILQIKIDNGYEYDLNILSSDDRSIFDVSKNDTLISEECQKLTQRVSKNDTEECQKLTQRVSKNDTVDTVQKSLFKEFQDPKERSKERSKEIFKKKKEKKNKITYAEFIKLTEKEYNALIDKFGEFQTTKMIEKLNLQKGARGLTYKSDYMAIYSWVKGWYEENREKIEKNKPRESDEEFNTRLKKIADEKRAKGEL